MEVTALIIDNFLDNPDAVRNSAISLDFKTVGNFPGKRTDRADKNYERYVQEKIERVLNIKISEWSLDSFCFQLCLEGEETWVHKDDSEWAAVLYLTPDAPIESGTGLYKDVDLETENFELDIGMGNVYNRIVIYKGTKSHRSILAGFGNSKETGRLTQVFFFRTENG